VLLTCILASSLAFIDGSVINVGLPAIGRALRAGGADLQWIVNAYLLPLSALLLLGGAAGDRFGRRRLLILGTALFGAASIACALAPDLRWLIASRLAQGAAGALLMPNSLALLGATFQGEAKGRAVGLWAATGAGLAAVGPVLGGLLIDAAHWRWIFLLNVPIAFSAVVLARAFVPPDPAGGDRRLDTLGGVLATAGLGAVTYGLTLGTGPTGWDRAAGAALLGGAGVLAAFVAVQRRRGPRAMMPTALFVSPAFVGLTLFTAFLYGALSALMVVVPYVLILDAGYSSAAAGAALLPLPVILTLTSSRMGALAGRVGPRKPLMSGALLAGLGFLLMLRVGQRVDYWRELFPALLVFSIGMSAAVAPLTTAVLSSVDASYTGVASGFNSAVARTGGMLATALLGTVLASSGPALIANFHAALLGCAVAAGLAAGFAAYVPPAPRRP
jgi:EmrB/QacA subfamily drug resistance transporter